jgi:uncharacterized protein with NRDE domain
MCTIIVLFRAHPDHALVVAANRDELYTRGSTVPGPIEGVPGAVAPRDLEHGGTWMGARRDGFFVGLTNQRTHSAHGPRTISRGRVPLEVLARGTVDGARAFLAEIDPASYRPFNLIYGDRNSLEVAYLREDGVETVALEPGVHVLVNDRIGSPDFPKVERVRALVDPSAPAEDLFGVLADRELPPLDAIPLPPPGSPFSRELLRELQAICIRTPFYGTVSATCLAMDASGPARYLFADGPPDRVLPRDYAALFG